MLKARKGIASLITVIGAALLIAAPGHARADACSVDGLQLFFTADSGLTEIHRNGDQLDLGAVVRNDAAGACPVTDAQVTIRPPTTHGDPGPGMVVAEDASFASGLGPTPLLPTMPYTVDLGDGVFSAPVTLTHRGTVHLPPGPRSSSGSTSQLIAISRPITEVTATPNVASGPPPLTVTYSYTVKNVSPAPPPVPEIGPAPGLVPNDPGPEARQVLTDDLCGTPEYESGDVHLSDPAVLDPGPSPRAGEMWRFTCTRTFDRPGIYKSKVEVAGSSTRDGRPWPVSGTEATVTVTGVDLTVEKTHRGSFLAGGTGNYAITVTNRGSIPTSGPVKVTDLMPPGMTVAAISGDGWTCSKATVSCSRTNPLPAGNSYPPVSLTVEVADDAPSLVTNVAKVEGGGQLGVTTDNDSASDPTVIRSPLSPVPTVGSGLRILRVKSARNGTAIVRVRAQRPGILRVLDRHRPPQFKSEKRRFSRPRTVTIRLRPTRALRKRLRHRQMAGKSRPVKVKATFRFRHSSGRLSQRYRALFFKLR